MAALEIVFWVCLGVVLCAFFVYPLLLALVRSVRARPWQRGPYQGSISIVLCVHNEEANLPRRLDELTRFVRSSGLRGEILVVSDGSTDGTVAIAEARAAEGLVRVLARPQREGKAAALSAGCAAATGDVLIFADARQRWADDTLTLLLENFADPQVGAVSGDLVVEAAPGVMAGVGLYWRFEKWLRQSESLIHSQVGVTGAVSACRRQLFEPIPAGTMCDDVYWPLQVARKGYRVVHDGRARAFDRLPDRPRDEFRRKVRTLAGNYQLLTLLPGALLPWCNPVWLPWLFHKLIRLLVPWALVGLMAANLGLVASCPPAWWNEPSTEHNLSRDLVWPLALSGQAGFYLLALASLLPGPPRRWRLPGAAASFVVLNAAAFLAFWVWGSGRANKAWTRTTYAPP